MGWDATGGTTSSWLKDENPLQGAVISGFCAGLGYGSGKLISSGDNKWGYIRSNGFDPKYNPDIQGGANKVLLGVSKDLKPAELPGGFRKYGVI